MNLVPVNLSVADVHAMAGLPTDGDLPEVPAVSELSNWDQEVYSLDVSAATSLGFPVGNLSASYKRQALLFGSSRWRDVEKNGHSYRFGVALRGIVVISDIKGSGALTLPVVAAKVELEGARATAQLMVRGYKGSKLSDALPGWQTFGVDSYSQYMKSVSDIQKLVLDDEPSIVPELLATTAISHATVSAAASVGTVYGLHAIAEDATLNHAIGKCNTSDDGVIAGLRAVYASRMGSDEKAEPTDDQKKAAAEELFGLHLRENHFWDR